MKKQFLPRPKAITSYPLLFLLFITLFSCSESEELEHKIRKESHALAPFSSVVNTIGVPIKVRYGEQHSIQVKGTTAQIEALEKQGTGAHLVLGFVPGTKTSTKGMQITLTLPHLTKLTNLANGSIHFDGFDLGHLSMYQNGSGKIVAGKEVFARTIHIHQKGKGLVQVSSLKAHHAKVVLKGKARCKVYAYDTIDAYVSKKANLQFQGEAFLTTSKKA